MCWRAGPGLTGSRSGSRLSGPRRGLGRGGRAAPGLARCLAGCGRAPSARGRRRPPTTRNTRRGEPATPATVRNPERRKADCASRPRLSARPLGALRNSSFRTKPTQPRPNAARRPRAGSQPRPGRLAATPRRGRSPKPNAQQQGRSGRSSGSSSGRDSAARGSRRHRRSPSGSPTLAGSGRVDAPSARPRMRYSRTWCCGNCHRKHFPRARLRNVTLRKLGHERRPPDTTLALGRLSQAAAALPRPPLHNGPHSQAKMPAATHRRLSLRHASASSRRRSASKPASL